MKGSVVGLKCTCLRDAVAAPDWGYGCHRGRLASIVRLGAPLGSPSSAAILSTSSASIQRNWTPRFGDDPMRLVVLTQFILLKARMNLYSVHRR